MPDLGDMAEYLGDHSGLGNKILYAVWNVEEIDEELYGKIDCYLTEPLSPEETEKTAWGGQRAEQRRIRRIL